MKTARTTEFRIKRLESTAKQLQKRVQAIEHGSWDAGFEWIEVKGKNRKGELVLGKTHKMRKLSD
jgi:hypothetical protein